MVAGQGLDFMLLLQRAELAMKDYARRLEVMCFVLFPFLPIMFNQIHCLLNRGNPLFGLMYEENTFLLEVR